MRYLLLAALFLTSCKAKQINWAFECSQRFPINTVYLQGKDTTLWDTIIEPGLIIQADPIILKAKCPDSKIIKGITKRVDTLRISDKAKEAYLQLQLEQSIDNNKQLSELNIEAVKTAKKAIDNERKKTSQRNYLIFGLILSIAWIFRKFISKLIIPFS